MNTRKQGYSVKVLEGPKICDIGTGIDMVMYRFVYSQPHMPLSKITVYLSRLENQQQPEVANVVAEQLKVTVCNNGGKFSNCYIYRGGLLRPIVAPSPRFSL